MCAWRRSSPVDPWDETRPWQTPHQRPWGRGPSSTMSRFPDLQKVWGDKCVFSLNFRVVCYSNRWLTHLYNMHLNICSLNKGIKEMDKLWLPRWLSGKESACHRVDPWVRKIPWRRKWQSTPVFSPGKSHGQRSLVGYSPWGHKELDTT